MKFLAIVPARGGSKGVPRKNVRALNGRPLIAYTLDAAAGARGLDRTIVSTDDDEIAAVARGLGAEVRMRPADLAGDDSPTLSVLQHHVGELAAEGYAPDAVVTLQPTSPLRRPRHIDESIAMFRADPRADSLVSCVGVPHIFHPRSVMRRDDEGYLRAYRPESDTPTRRQDKEPLFARNGAAVYITRIGCLDRFVFGGRLLAYEMAPEDSLDIDTEDDLRAAEAALAARDGPAPA